MPVWLDKSPILLLTGGAGGGKSKCIAEKVHGLMLKYPGSTGLIIRKSRESMVNSTLIFLDRDIMGNDPRVEKKEAKHRYEYTNGSILAWGGMKDEAQREQIRSIGQKGALDFVWMEEANAFKEEDFNEVQARMRGRAAPWRQTILTTNPDAANHWINRRLILGKEATMFLSKASDNPANDNQYLQTLQRLTGVQKLRLCDGKWVRAEGVIYKDFREDIHVVGTDQLIIDNTGALCVHDYKQLLFGADSNFPKPRAAIIVGFRGDGTIDILDEFYMRRTKVETLGDWLVEWQKKYRNPIHGYHDPSDPDAIDTLDGFQGIRCEKGNNNVIPGISEVSTYFASNKIRIHKRCVNLIEELQGYVWKPGSDEEIPLKKKDHLMDALRYLLNSIKEVVKKNPSITFIR